MIGRISHREEVAEDTLLVEFDLTPRKIEFKPGQFFFITLKGLLYDDPRGNIRHFSLVNPPEDNGKIVMTTRQTGSGFKKSLSELPLGTQVQIGSIEGDFTLPENNKQPLLFLAGGIGITPFMSMLRAREIPGGSVTLIHSNRNQQSTPFFKELLQLSESKPDFKLIFTMTQDPGWHGEKGRIDYGFIKEHIEGFRGCLIYVAGPPSFTKDLKQNLLDSGLSRDQVKAEIFSGYK